MTALTNSWERLIVGAIIIAAVSSLSAVGTITGSQALAVIVGIGSLLLGAAINTSGVNTGIGSKQG